MQELFILFIFKVRHKKCPEPESNQRHEDFQSSALPTELSGHRLYKSLSCGSRIWTCDLRVMSPTSFQTAPSRDIKLISQKRKADDRTRTDNLLITNQLLCQLSHIGLKKWDLQGSNLWPSACKADALPAELRSHYFWHTLQFLNHWSFMLCVNDPDGTRTRDLRRDRAAL